MKLEGTTIIAVQKNGKCAVAGDGQVTMSETVIMKATAKKVRRLYHDQVVVGSSKMPKTRTMSPV